MTRIIALLTLLACSLLLVSDAQAVKPPVCRFEAGHTSGSVTRQFLVRHGTAIHATLTRNVVPGEPNPGLPRIDLRLDQGYVAGGLYELDYVAVRGGQAVVTYRSGIAFDWTLKVCG